MNNLDLFAVPPTQKAVEHRKSVDYRQTVRAVRHSVQVAGKKASKGQDHGGRYARFPPEQEAGHALIESVNF